MVKKEGIFYLLVLIAVVAVSFYIVRPFINALLTGMILAYMFHPLYSLIQSRLRFKGISAFIVCALIVVIVSIPALFLLENGSNDAKYLYLIIKQRITTGNLLGFECYELDKPLCQVVSGVKKVITDPDISVYIQDFFGKVAILFFDGVTQTLLSLPKIFLNLSVSFFVMFYFLIDGKNFALRLKKLIPVSQKHQDHIFNKIKDVIYSVLYGTVVVALIQGALGALGFWIFGLPSPIFWGLAMAILALIPFGATGIIWVPASLMLLANGLATDDHLMVWKGIGLFAYSLIFVATLDNVIRSKIIGDRSGIHPVIVFIGALGGITVFGAIGFVIGPLVLALLESLIGIYELERRHI